MGTCGSTYCAQVPLAGGELRLLKAPELRNSGRMIRSDEHTGNRTAAPIDEPPRERYMSLSRRGVRSDVPHCVRREFPSPSA